MSIRSNCLLFNGHRNSIYCFDEVISEREREEGCRVRRGQTRTARTGRRIFQSSDVSVRLIIMINARWIGARRFAPNCHADRLCHRPQLRKEIRRSIFEFRPLIVSIGEHRTGMRPCFQKINRGADGTENLAFLSGFLLRLSFLFLKEQSLLPTKTRVLSDS